MNLDVLMLIALVVGSLGLVLLALYARDGLGCSPVHKAARRIGSRCLLCGKKPRGMQ